MVAGEAVKFKNLDNGISFSLSFFLHFQTEFKYGFCMASVTPLSLESWDQGSAFLFAKKKEDILYIFGNNNMRESSQDL